MNLYSRKVGTHRIARDFNMYGAIYKASDRN